MGSKPHLQSPRLSGAPIAEDAASEPGLETLPEWPSRLAYV